MNLSKDPTAEAFNKLKSKVQNKECFDCHSKDSN